MNGLTMLNQLNVGVIRFNLIGEISFINKFACLKLKTNTTATNIKIFLDEEDIIKYSEVYFTQKDNQEIDYLKTFLFGVGKKKQSTLIWNLITTDGNRIKSKVTIKQISNDEQSEYLIQDILDNFDFEKVSLVMKFLDWRWASIGRVPTITELKESAKEQMSNCIKEAKNDKSDFYISSGGLKSFYNFNDNFLKLEFVLTDWDEEDDLT